MKLTRPAINAPALAAVCAAFIILVDNSLFWSSLFKVVDPRTAHGVLFAVAAFAILTGALTAIFLLLSVSYLFQPLLMAVLILSSVIRYFSSGYGVIIDRVMLQSVLETDNREAAELLSAAFAVHVLLFGILPALAAALVRVRSRPLLKEITFRLASIGMALTVAAGAALLSYKDLTLMGREHKELRMAVNPLYAVYSALTYGRHRERTPAAVAAIGTDASRKPARPGKKKTVVILVVGETARSKEFSLNGYERNTNPFLEEDGVISFTRAYACGTATAESLPCMFSHLDRTEYSVSKAAQFENVLDVLSRAGISVLWRDNNAGCKGVCARVTMEDLSHGSTDGVCTSGECYDEILLSGLPERLQSSDSDALIVLHQKGSHGPAYFKRHPENFSVFEPECSNSSPETCANNDIINAYDNTILYTDYFLHRTIDLLRRNSGAYDTLLVYFSDHGESLGENGVYLHGLPYFLAPEEQTRVPLILWMSKGYAANQNLDQECLQAKRHEQFSHSNIFHTLLGAFDVRTDVYRQNRDIFAQCRSVKTLAAAPSSHRPR
ncbi:MAG: phosphoethanolamine--lipid A transferase [Nitrospirota bacterium]|nr:phosphoethanolamine--lipid A transferase [Nitrospirota bacterium]